MFKIIKRKIITCFKGEIYYYKSLGVTMGTDCSFNGRVNFGSEPFLVTLGNNVRCADNVSFITHDGGIHVIRNLTNRNNIDIFGKITVGNNVFIGLNSIILPSVCIGNNVIVGAGSVVSKSIPNNEVWAGVPAKFICTIEEYTNKNFFKIKSVKHLNPIEKKDYLIKELN